MFNPKKIIIQMKKIIVSNKRGRIVIEADKGADVHEVLEENGITKEILEKLKIETIESEKDEK